MYCITALGTKAEHRQNSFLKKCCRVWGSLIRIAFQGGLAAAEGRQSDSAIFVFSTDVKQIHNQDNSVCMLTTILFDCN